MNVHLAPHPEMLGFGNRMVDGMTQIKPLAHVDIQSAYFQAWDGFV